MRLFGVRAELRRTTAELAQLREHYENAAELIQSRWPHPDSDPYYGDAAPRRQIKIYRIMDGSVLSLTANQQPFAAFPITDSSIALLVYEDSP